jgi:hypothetical protein
VAIDVTTGVPRGWKAVKAFYGDPAFLELSGGNVDLDDAWEAQNLVLLRKVGGTKLNVRLHYKVAPYFLAAFAAALTDAPAYTVRLLGGFCARHQRHDPRLPLSLHAYGAAVDVNWDTNPMGKILVTDLPRTLVDAFRNHGWEWGGDWTGVKDPMHFQYARGV